MSNTDPDLRPTQGNRPTAIDVVDGELVVKRANGRKESWPLGGGGVDLSGAPGYAQVTYADLDVTPNLPQQSLVPSEIVWNPGSDSPTWNYSGSGPDLMEPFIASDPTPLGDGISADVDGGLLITEAGLYFFQATLFITEGVGDTGDDSVGEFLGEIQFAHGAPFQNPVLQKNQTVKYTNIPECIITGIVPIWEVMLQDYVAVLPDVSHTSGGSLTCNGSMIAMRVS